MQRSRVGIRRGALVPALAAGWLMASASSAMPLVGTSASTSAAHWRVLDALPSRGEPLAALAASASGEVAVGDAAGVSWWRDGRWSRAQTPAVRDLAFDGAGRLWIGTLEGLFVWAPEARPQRRTLRDGEASGRVSRIEAKGEVLVVATEAGAYWSSSGSVWQTLNAGSADQPVRWVAIRRAAGEASAPTGGAPSPGLAEVWSYGAEGLLRTRGVEAAAGLRIVDRIVWPLPRPVAEAAAVDLVLDSAAARLFVVYGDAIAWLELAGSDPRTGRWRWLRPVLPPGAVIRRLVFGSDATLWLATDHGLHASASLDAPFVRVPNPAGSRECTDVVDGPVPGIVGHAGFAALEASGAGPEAEVVAGSTPVGGPAEAGRPLAARAIALCRTTLLALVDAASPSDGPSADGSDADGPGADDSGTDAAGADVGGADAPVADAPPAAVAPILLPADPPVAAIRDRALARVGLGVERADGLWRGLRSRALLPSLQLRGAWDDDRDLSRSHNQTFVSGDTRNLLDRDRDDGRHYGATVVLDWDLGGLAYANQSVDLYRELRQVTSLRDDVSDEIHQLYFERQRIRARLMLPAALAPGEALELTLRAEELDAGLDAWTGGWIRAWRTDQPTAAPPIHPGRSTTAIDAHP
ncbi:MAG: hypothetical protein U0900_08195 [Myxococcota bacterium]